MHGNMNVNAAPLLLSCFEYPYVTYFITVIKHLGIPELLLVSF